MIDKLMKKLVRFLSIVGGFSSPEDIERAKRRGSSHESMQPESGKTDVVAMLPPENRSVK